MNLKSFVHLTNGYIPNDNIKLRLAILGSPGSGKSTLSSGLLYFSKLFFFKVDSVPEVAKWHIYKRSDFSSPNFEINKYNEQKNLEEIYPSELDILICEAPLVISAIYASYYYGEESEISKEMFRLALESKNRYSHFIVSRKLVKFESFGRNETERQSEELHFKTIEILERLSINYIVINRYDEHIPLQILSMLGAIKKIDSNLDLDRSNINQQELLPNNYLSDTKNPTISHNSILS